MAIETAGQQKYADLTEKNQIITDRNDCLISLLCTALICSFDNIIFGSNYWMCRTCFGSVEQKKRIQQKAGQSERQRRVLSSAGSTDVLELKRNNFRLQRLCSGCRYGCRNI